VASQPSTVIVPCVQCGVEVERLTCSLHRPCLCSNACKISRYRANMPDRVAVSRQKERRLARIADQARVRVVTWRNRPVVERWQDRCDRERDARAGLMASLPCLVCRRPVDYLGMGRPRRYCSELCAAVSPVQVRLRRTSKARRRALERGLEAERFDPIEVLARDGWRCHICKVSTPKRLRGSYDDRAPELDHIIPLAEGGKHTRINTACACRKCNNAKGARPLGQLRLVA
jgi:5-methylcytosine-specific restriction endonuclease McrA